MPTRNTDGSTIPATGPGSLTVTIIERGTCSSTNPLTFGAVQETVSVNAPATTYTFQNLAPARYCFRAKVRNTYGVESDYTPAVSKVIDPPKPQPPVLTVAAVVHGLNMSPVFGITILGGRGSTVLGFAPVGARCDGPKVYRYRGLDWHRITAIDQVLWWASTPTTNAALPCA
ncbi:MAG: hypothetical protein NZM12_01465 [Steroidobacteraceae bacterium]|nr:hypothetical protein [Steroidobacteraceae bacterium]MDW8260845.1 hypothetical protein [Gammaproteobacteria bacterium]